MIVRFGRPGTSFKGVLAYLTHDAGHAATSERLAWSETRNVAYDDIDGALHSMLMTTRDAEFLRIAATGSAHGGVEKPVKHISLNWHPDERPDREEMVRAADGFLQHMGWQEHEAVILAHDDRAHRHVHIVLNAVHPESGRKLDDGFERRRAQKWALGYEQERGMIVCPQRLLPAAEREVAMPRPIWLLLQAAIDAERRVETARLTEAPDLHLHQAEAIEQHWRTLKAIQREQRLAFVATGRFEARQLRDDIYRSVSQAFRSEWAAYYEGQRIGLEPEALATIKADLLARQKDELTLARDGAMATYREERDKTYRALLDRQKEQRAVLTTRLQQGAGAAAMLAGFAEAAGMSAPVASPGGPGPSPGSSPRPDAPFVQPAPTWTHRAGMRAQAGSAERALGRVAGNLRRASAAQEDASPPRPARTSDRISKPEARQPLPRTAAPPRHERGVEPEPD